MKETVLYPDKTNRLRKNKYVSSRKLNGVTLEVVYIKERNIKIVTAYPIQ